MSWKQIDGNVPFLDWSEEPSNSDKYPKSFWLQKDGSMPYRATPWTDDIVAPGWVSDGTDSPFQIDFSIMKEIDTYPKSSWILESSSTYELKQIPYKRAFPEMFVSFDSAPKSMWVLDSKAESPYKVCFPKLYRPHKEKPPKYRTMKIIITNYNQQVIIKHGKDVG